MKPIPMPPGIMYRNPPSALDCCDMLQGHCACGSHHEWHEWPERLGLMTTAIVGLERQHLANWMDWWKAVLNERKMAEYLDRCERDGNT